MHLTITTGILLYLIFGVVAMVVHGFETGRDIVVIRQQNPNAPVTPNYLNIFYTGIGWPGYFAVRLSAYLTLRKINKSAAPVDYPGRRPLNQ